MEPFTTTFFLRPQPTDVRAGMRRRAWTSSVDGGLLLHMQHERVTLGVVAAVEGRHGRTPGLRMRHVAGLALVAGGLWPLPVG